MRYRQLDKIIELIPGQRIVATRELHKDEDYLRDHFPLFPVMPGVMMLEALFQASMWLVHATDNFENAMLTLDEVRNVKFADFMQPGQVLTVTVEWDKSDDKSVKVKAQGMRGEVVAVSGRLVIGKKNLGDATNPQLMAADEFARSTMRQEMEQLIAKNASI
ncbi:MAG: AfsA-related hotdog domain-containing protein [Planctomycetota bacterium]